MGMTATMKILSASANLKNVVAGQLIESRLDMVLGNDITAPVAINELDKAGIDHIFSKEKIALVMDHFAPNKDIKAASQCKQVRDFARKHSIKNFFDIGEMGIEHVLLPEKGLVKPGDCIIGADSHTCTYGALGAFSTGVGSTDMAAGMATGKAWFKVPPAINIKLEGTLPKNVSGKDVILYIIGEIGVDGALYKSIEFSGRGINSLSMSDRFCISNMVVEAGAKNGIFPVDDITISFLKGVGITEYTTYEPDDDCEYESEVIVDLSNLRRIVSFPHIPENTRVVDEIDETIKIDQVVIGSCTNGRYEDLEIAARVIGTSKIAKGLRCIIIPATMEIYLKAVRNGLVETFVNAGAIVSTPTCGPCLGGHMGVLAKGERAVSTTNRNFVGRMGHSESYVYLSSPYTAAEVALKGYLGGN